MGKTRLALEMGTIKGVLWHQGESDTVTDERANHYEENLHALVRDLRDELQIKDLPFIAGDLGQLYGVGEDGEAERGKIARIKLVRMRLLGCPNKRRILGMMLRGRHVPVVASVLSQG